MTVADVGVRSATFWDRTLDGCHDYERRRYTLGETCSLGLRILGAPNLYLASVLRSE
jgi:hypothetical protein